MRVPHWIAWLTLPLVLALTGHPVSVHSLDMTQAPAPSLLQNVTEIPLDGPAVVANTTCPGCVTQTDRISSRSRSRGGAGLISKSQSEAFQNIANGVRCALHTVTIPLLSLAVFSFAAQKPISVCHSFIIAINALELLCNVINLVYFIILYSVPKNAWVSIFWAILANYGIVCCRRSVYILNLILSAQRLLAVTSPLKARSAFTKTSRNVTFICVIVGMFALHVYMALQYNVAHYGGGAYGFGYTNLYKDNTEAIDTMGTIAKALFSYVPILLSLLINFVLIYCLKRYNEKAKALRTTKEEDKKAQQDRQMTLMVLVSTLTFTVLSLPPNLNRMIATFVPDYGSHSKEQYLFRTINTTALGVQTFGDIANFLIYATLSVSFRNQLLGTLSAGRFKWSQARLSGGESSAKENN